MREDGPQVGWPSRARGNNVATSGAPRQGERLLSTGLPGVRERLEHGAGDGASEAASV